MSAAMDRVINIAISLTFPLGAAFATVHRDWRELLWVGAAALWFIGALLSERNATRWRNLARQMEHRPRIVTSAEWYESAGAWFVTCRKCGLIAVLDKRDSAAAEEQIEMHMETHHAAL